jgi:hypothetical protein
METLKIIKVCFKCRSAYDAPEGYDLNYQYGEPPRCPKCRKEDAVAAFEETKEIEP